MQPWGKQKQLVEENKIPSQKDILTMSDGVKIEQQKVLFLLTYMTAGRVSEVLALRAEDIEHAFKDSRELILIHMVNRKNKTRKNKDIPIPLDREQERLLIEPILSYVKIKATGPLFDFKSHTRAWQIFKQIGYNPHWLRHIRLTHLETIYGLSGEKIKNFAGWTDTRPAKHYMELNWGDILSGM